MRRETIFYAVYQAMPTRAQEDKVHDERDFRLSVPRSPWKVYCFS